VFPPGLLRVFLKIDRFFSLPSVLLFLRLPFPFSLGAPSYVNYGLTVSDKHDLVLCACFCGGEFSFPFNAFAMAPSKYLLFFFLLSFMSSRTPAIIPPFVCPTLSIFQIAAFKRTTTDAPRPPFSLSLALKECS